MKWCVSFPLNFKKEYVWAAQSNPSVNLPHQFVNTPSHIAATFDCRYVLVYVAILLIRKRAGIVTPEVCGPHC